MVTKNELALETDVETDCQPLADLVATMLSVCPDIHCLRDATRGGLATALNEFAQSSRVAIRLDENALPMREAVRGACEILGLDPLLLSGKYQIAVY
jgi:hydrogenase expression/formation protein HypE